MTANPRFPRLCGLVAAALAVAGVANVLADPMAAEDRRLLADGLMSRGLFERAAAEYDALLRDYPEIGERDTVLFRWGDSLRQTKRTEEADAVFARLLADFPSSSYAPRALFNRGAIALAAGRYDAAADFLRRVSDAKPAVREDALYYLAEALSRGGRDADAIPRFEAFLKEFPESQYAWFAKVSLALALERRAGDAADSADARRARELLLAASKAPDDAVAAESLYLLGQCDFTRGDYAASAASFAELRRRFPESRHTAEAASRAAWANERSGNPAETLALAEAALRDPAVPQRDEWLYLKGRALFQLDRDGGTNHVAEATKAMEELVNTCDSSRFLVSAAFACASGHARLGHDAEALAIAAIIPRNDPIHPLVLRLSAFCHDTLGQKDKAIECFRELDRDHPDADDAEDTLFRLARLLQETSRWEESAECWSRFAERFPKSGRHAAALYAEGVCLKAANRIDDALAAWRRLAERHPDDDLAADARYLSGIELFRLKRADEALAAFDACLAAGDKAAHRADALFYRGCLLAQKDRFDDALASFQNARRASPSPDIDAECRFQTWFVLQKLDRLDEAADELDALIALPAVAPRLQPGQIAWAAEHQYHRGHLDEARRAARYLADTAAEDDWRQTAWAWLGRVEAARGDAAAAETAFRNAVGVSARTRYAAEARFRLGEYRLAAKDIAAAERHFTQAIEESQARDMVDVRVRATVGLAHTWLAQGRKEDAVRQLVAVCMISRDDTLIPPLIAEAVPLLRELGREDEAKVLLDDLRELYPTSDAARALLPPPEPTVPTVPKVEPASDAARPPEPAVPTVPQVPAVPKEAL